MYKLESKTFGYALTFSGYITREEMEAWVQESRTALSRGSTRFGVLVDMRGLKPLPAPVKAVMEEGQRLYKAAGMTRSAVILDSHLIAMQFKSIAKETGIYEWERYLSTADQPNWETLAMHWIRSGTDPDKVGPAPG